MEIADVDVKTLQYHCTSDTMVPEEFSRGPLSAGTVMDSSAGSTCFSDGLPERLNCQFPGRRNLFPFQDVNPEAPVADGRSQRIERQTGRLQITVRTPWAPVVLPLSCAVMPERRCVYPRVTKRFETS